MDFMNVFKMLLCLSFGLCGLLLQHAYELQPTDALFDDVWLQIGFSTSLGMPGYEKYHNVILLDRVRVCACSSLVPVCAWMSVHVCGCVGAVVWFCVCVVCVSGYASACASMCLVPLLPPGPWPAPQGVL